MFGLAVIGIGLLYILLCIFAVWLTIKKTKKHSSQKRLLFGIGMLLAYNAPLGYYILPPMIAKPVYCQQSGFWLYKTPEQWKQENPGVAETLTLDGEQVNRVLGERKSERVWHLNERFDWRIVYSGQGYRVSQELQTVEDRKTGEVMAKRIDYFAHASPLYAPRTCFRKEEREKWLVGGNGFRVTKNIFMDLGEKK